MEGYATGDPLLVSVAQRERRNLNKLVVLLLILIFFVEFLPSEAFLYDFLRSKRLSRGEIFDEIFPLWNYAKLPSLVLMGLLSESVGNLGTLVVGLLFGAATVSITALGTSVGEMRVTQFTVALADASHTGALFGLLFEIMNRGSGTEGFQTTVHWAQAVLLLANCCAGLVGSIWREKFHVPYQELWFVSMASQAVALSVVFVLSIGCLRQRVGLAKPSFLWYQLRDVAKHFWLVGVREWTLGLVCSNLVHDFVLSYWQGLLPEADRHENYKNGYVTAAAYFLPAAFLMLTARTRVFKKLSLRRTFISVLLLIAAVLVFFMGRSASTYMVYPLFVAYEFFFKLFGVIAMHQVAASVCTSVETDRVERRAEYRARLALLFSVTAIFCALAESGTQWLFETLPGHSKKGLLFDSTRLEGLGVFLGCSAVLFFVGSKLGCVCVGQDEADLNDVANDARSQT